MDTTADLIAGWLGGAGQSRKLYNFLLLVLTPSRPSVGVIVGNPFEVSAPS